MILCKLYFDISIDVIELVNVLCELPPALRPHRFTVTENRTSPLNVVTDKALFEEFVEQNPLGFLMYTSGRKSNTQGKSVYDLTPHKRDGYLILTFLDDDELATPRDFDALFELGLQFDLKFGFCCETEEYYHRNRLFYKLPNSSVEAWIGRYLRHTVPGLYWKTAISSDTEKRFGLDVTSLMEGSLDSQRICTQLILLTFFEDAAEWESNRVALDHLCHATRGIFSRRELDENLATGLNRVEFNKVKEKFG